MCVGGWRCGRVRVSPLISLSHHTPSVDHTRVALKDADGGDYINANYLKLNEVS